MMNHVDKVNVIVFLGPAFSRKQALEQPSDPATRPIPSRLRSVSYSTPSQHLNLKEVPSLDLALQLLPICRSSHPSSRPLTTADSELQVG